MIRNLFTKTKRKYSDLSVHEISELIAYAHMPLINANVDVWSDHRSMLCMYTCDIHILCMHTAKALGEHLHRLA